MKKANRRKNLEKELQKLNVGIVCQFGSTVQGASTLNSDVDLGIVFADFHVPDNLLRIHDDLYILFSGIYPTREVDIVFLQTSHLTLQLNVINHGRVIYQVSPV
ncbi:MAG: nucleotidyltransferase domain-containing protein, partial [Desulfobacterales bacterium]